LERGGGQREVRAGEGGREGGSEERSDREAPASEGEVRGGSDEEGREREGSVE